MTASGPDHTRTRARWRSMFQVRSLIEDDWLERAFFTPRYFTMVALAVGSALLTEVPVSISVLLLIVGVSLSALIHLLTIRNGHPPLWMPFVDVAVCVAFAASTPRLYTPSAFIALAVVTLAATMYGPGISFANVALGVAGFILAAQVQDVDFAMGTVVGFGASGSMIATTVGLLAEAGSKVRRRLDHLVGNIDAVLWIADPATGEFDFVNRRSIGSLDVDVRHWGDVDFWREQVHPDDLQETLEAFAAAFVDGVDTEVRYRHRAPDGSYRTMHDRVTVARDESNRVTALYGMSLDVTEEVLTEQRVNRYADIVHRIDQALVVVQLDDEDNLELVAANPASEELLQRRLGDLRGTQVTAVFPTVAGAALEERLKTVIATGRTTEVEGIVLTGPGRDRRIVTLRAFPLPDRAAGLSLLDVTDAHAAEEALRRQAHYDGLTGLPNRRVLDDELQRAVRDAPRTGCRVALLMMDLDQFKEVNDALGHHVGDQLLRSIGDRLTATIQDCLIARLGGDEFAVLVTGPVNEDEIREVAERVRTALSDPFIVDDIRLQSNASIGIAIYPEQASDAATLIQRADVAMYSAKRSGKGIAFYDRDHDRSSVTRLTLSSDLPTAVADGQLELHYQPFIDLRTGEAVRAEALVRWKHPTWGLLQPDDFIELAGLTGAIQPLTRWVLQEGITSMARWRALGHRMGLAVNLSVRNLYDPDLVAHIGDLLEESGVDPKDLVLELTETELMEDANLARTVFETLRDLGVQTAIDDFGTGYSSMTFLRDLPLREIKIDRSFVSHLHERSDDFTIVRSMIDLGHNLGLEVVGEGVEHEAHLETLVRLGCDLAQGFHFSRPIPIDDLLVWLANRSAAPASHDVRADSGSRS
ncbi:MAG: EAL domain-containing protein [Acidimicrobiales bacterium]|nr:EAL domain-containing protein [Acidimicrobiales bacterium]